MVRQIWKLALCVVGIVLVSGSPPASAQPFTYTFVNPILDDVSYGTAAFADFNQDGRFDVVAAGNVNTFPPLAPGSYVALSEGDAPIIFESGRRAWQHFYQQTPLAPALWHSTVAPMDYDGDGDLDVFIAGATRADPPFDAVARLYRNDGAGHFDAVNPGLDGVFGGTAAWGDYDNDGDPDLLVMGSSADEQPTTRLYRNDNGSFVATDAALRDLTLGDAAWGDVDNDGDLDLVLSGADADGLFQTRLYRNDDGVLEETSVALPEVGFSSVDWGDYDNDGDLDLVVSGGVLSDEIFTGQLTIYRTIRGGNLQRISIDLPGILYGTASWGDYDVDGDLDLLVVGGRNAQGGRLGRMYRNEGGTFEHALSLVTSFVKPAHWGDYDGDGDLDLFTTGLNAENRPLAGLFRNDTPLVNPPPEPPGGLQANVAGNTVTLSWTAATDDPTPAPGLTYNLRVGTTPGSGNVMPALAAPETGHRWLSARGNVDHNTRWVLKELPPGTYTWSVQAIDSAYRGSPFAAEGTFTVSSTTDVDTGTGDAAGLPVSYALHPAYPNPFRDAATLAYDLPETAPVVLRIYNVLGAEVHTLVDQVQPGGRQQVVWDGRDRSGRRVGAGVYFARIRAGGFSQSQTLIVVN